MLSQLPPKTACMRSTSGTSRLLGSCFQPYSRLQNRRSMQTQALFNLGKPPKENLEQKKQELLQYISGLNRGVSADEEDKQQVERLAKELERLNPTKKPLASPLVNDAENLKAANRETWPFFNQVSAALTPVSDSQVDVQFKQFKILGLIPITAPESAKGSLSVSYLDEELRISRGDKGNLFVLVMDDSSERP